MYMNVEWFPGEKQINGQVRSGKSGARLAVVKKGFLTIINKIKELPSAGRKERKNLTKEEKKIENPAKEMNKDREKKDHKKKSKKRNKKKKAQNKN
jgi:hypothetical protein